MGGAQKWHTQGQTSWESSLVQAKKADGSVLCLQQYHIQHQRGPWESGSVGPVQPWPSSEEVDLHHSCELMLYLVLWSSSGKAWLVQSPFQCHRNEMYTA